MPETSFFVDNEDEQLLVSFILEQGGRLIPDLRYPSATYSCVNYWSQYESLRSETGFFFVLFDSYDKWPLRMELIETGHYAGRYFIMQRSGGPAINLVLSTMYKDDCFSYISDGSIGYYKTYRNTVTGKMEEVSQELINKYKVIVKTLKKAAKTIAGQSGRKYVIGPHTYSAVESRTLKLGVEGLSVE